MNFEIVDVDELWYPPANILYHGNVKLGGHISSDAKKLIRESMSTAVMLVGMIKATGQDYWLQPVRQNEQTPDVRTMRLVEENGKPNVMEIQEIEVVTLERNSDEDVDDFLKRTKLSPKKSYPVSTIILCHFDKNVKAAKSWKDIHESLKGLSSPNQVYVLARVDPNNQKYQLVEVNPGLGIIEFDVNKELSSRPKQKNLIMRPGSESGFNPTPDEHIPFIDLK